MEVLHAKNQFSFNTTFVIFDDNKTEFFLTDVVRHFTIKRTKKLIKQNQNIE
jgi:hypothetical protein